MKRKKVLLTVLLALTLVVALGGVALAMSSTTYDLPWQAVSAGGGARESANHTLRDSSGQSSPIGVMESTSYRLNAGFWPGAVPVSLAGDATGDGRVDALDITKVERIIVRLDVPTFGADANQDGQMNALDITKVERLIAGLD